MFYRNNDRWRCCPGSTRSAWTGTGTGTGIPVQLAMSTDVWPEFQEVFQRQWKLWTGGHLLPGYQRFQWTTATRNIQTTADAGRLRVCSINFGTSFISLNFISWWSCIIDQHLNSAIFFLTETEKRLTHAWNPSSRASRYSAVIARIWWWTPPFSPPEEPSPSCVVLHVSSSFGIE